MKGLEASSVDAIVTDPPYGLSFMGKHWDHGIPGIAFWTEALRVAKPGAHLLAFGGTRTFHRLACAIEDAGWEIRDTVMWVYGSGFPKSHSVDKAIDKAAGAEREVVGRHIQSVQDRKLGNSLEGSKDASLGWQYDITAPATPAAKQWQGWGTALKPAWEPIIVARKPLQGTVAANVLAWGTGALNIDASRIGCEQTATRRNGDSGGNGAYGRDERVFTRVNPPGRWPANLIHDGSEEVVGLFPVTGVSRGGNSQHINRECYGRYNAENDGIDPGYGDSGSAARFFYCAKASKADRDEGLDGMEERQGGAEYRPNDDGSAGLQSRLHGATVKGRNHHPTIKPAALMRYLCRLVTPPDGVVLDPFMGSGSTGKAALQEGFRFVGIELEPEYLEIAKGRIAAVQPCLV
jgi:hypothetical protein